MDEQKNFFLLHFQKYEAMIAKYDFADVDWDKEHNSKHLQKERIMEKYVLPSKLKLCAVSERKVRNSCLFSD